MLHTMSYQMNGLVVANLKVAQPVACGSCHVDAMCFKVTQLSHDMSHYMSYSLNLQSHCHTVISLPSRR